MEVIIYLIYVSNKVESLRARLEVLMYKLIPIGDTTSAEIRSVILDGRFLPKKIIEAFHDGRSLSAEEKEKVEAHLERKGFRIHVDFMWLDPHDEN